MSKAREWWIDIRDGFMEIHFWDGNFNSDEAANCIHVIEKSALDDLQVKHDALKSLLAKKDLELDQMRSAHADALRMYNELYPLHVKEKERSAKLVEALRKVVVLDDLPSEKRTWELLWEASEVARKALAAYSDSEKGRGE